MFKIKTALWCASEWLELPDFHGADKCCIVIIIGNIED